MNRRANTPHLSPGVIRADELYTLAEIRSRLRLGSKGVAAAQRAGLRAVQVGRGKVVFGSDVLAWVRAMAVASAEADE